MLDFGLRLEPHDVTKYDYLRMVEKEKWGLLLRTAYPLALKEDSKNRRMYTDLWKLGARKYFTKRMLTKLL